jgi:hypothetical protein
MEKQGPMLEVNFSGLDRQPRCSICNEQFDAEGAAIDLLTAFILHVSLRQGKANHDRLRRWGVTS